MVFRVQQLFIKMQEIRRMFPCYRQLIFLFFINQPLKQVSLKPKTKLHSRLESKQVQNRWTQVQNPQAILNGNLQLVYSKRISDPFIIQFLLHHADRADNADFDTVLPPVAPSRPHSSRAIVGESQFRLTPGANDGSELTHLAEGHRHDGYGMIGQATGPAHHSPCLLQPSATYLKGNHQSRLLPEALRIFPGIYHVARSSGSGRPIPYSHPEEHAYLSIHAAQPMEEILPASLLELFSIRFAISQQNNERAFRARSPRGQAFAGGEQKLPGC